ncbi:MAG TPA: hypothetical protein VHR66_24515 [Gemmataceae bacterium]|jgi:hypothetical protein|nr:hypothetical protein [Gemmataceae bacterium]
MKGLAVTVLSMLAFASCASALGPCFSREQPTLREEAANAKVIVYGTIANAKRIGDGGTTDLIVSRVLKSDPAAAGKKVIQIDRYIEIPTDPDNPRTYLVYGDVEEGQVDFYRGEAVGPAVADYLAKSLATNINKDHVSLLKHCAKHFEHEEPIVAGDAVAEFQRAADADVRTACRAIDPDRLRRFLHDKDISHSRLGLYAMLLAHDGNRSDAVLIRDWLDKLADGSSSLEFLFTAYTLLDPVAGWAYTCNLIQNPKTEFMVRYSGLRAARYFQNTRPDVLSVDDRVKALRISLRHADMADLAIDDLRRWQHWKLTNEVLSITEQKGFDLAIIRRAQVKYAIQCPDEKAVQFVATMCATDPVGLREIRELLDAELSGK